MMGSCEEVPLDKGESHTVEVRVRAEENTRSILFRRRISDEALSVYLRKRCPEEQG